MQTGRLTRQQLKTQKKENNFGGWMLMQSKTVLKEEDEQQQEEGKDPLRLQFMSWFLFFASGCKHTFPSRRRRKPNMESVSRDDGTIKKQIYRSDALGMNGIVTVHQ